MYYVITSDVLTWSCNAGSCRALWSCIETAIPLKSTRWRKILECFPQINFFSTEERKTWTSWMIWGWVHFLENFILEVNQSFMRVEEILVRTSVRLVHLVGGIMEIPACFQSKQSNQVWKQPKCLACRRTTWAGTGVQLWGGWVYPRTASAFEWPRCPAKRPTAPRSSAAGGWPWSPAQGVELRPLHTGTPTRPAPVRHQQVRTSLQWIF